MSGQDYYVYVLTSKTPDVPVATFHLELPWVVGALDVDTEDRSRVDHPVDDGPAGIQANGRRIQGTG